MSAITLTNIHKSFGETRALAGASLETRLGEIHAIVGENGSGKSTLAKVMSGVTLPDDGDIDILGGHPQTPADAIELGISTIYQEIMVAEALSVWENVYAGHDGFWKRKLSTAEKKARSSEILARLANAKVDPDAAVADLPLNIKQWIVIARAILQKPKVLVFDESSAALDLEATNRLHAEMLALKAEGSCIILVTHRIAELVKITDTATVLSDGKTVGRLNEGDVTEANLLRLMSADERHTALGPRTRNVISTEQKPALEAKDLSIGGAPIEFKVHPGEIVGLAGLDGAGQSEFIQTLAGIYAPNAGQVQVWDGSTEAHVIASLDEAEAARITYVSGDRKKEGIFPNLSILENFGLALHGHHSGRAGVIAASKVEDQFVTEKDRLGIKFGSRQDRITTLSGGNQQKVLIARAFALNPRVILLNDPARGVDIGTKQDLYSHLREFASNGGAVVYLTTEIEELFDFADRADVFFERDHFASFDQAEITEDNLLAAMFGKSRPVSFDDAAASGGIA